MSNTVDQFLEDLAELIAARVVERLPQPSPAAPPTPQAADYLTTKQAAKFLALGTSTLETWRAKNEGPAFIKVGTAIRYSRAALDAFVEARARGGRK